MSNLVENNELYARLECYAQCTVHAIYLPEGIGNFGDCYCAAVDMFSPGFTFRVYFKLDENEVIHIVHVERWFLG